MLAKLLKFPLRTHFLSFRSRSRKLPSAHYLLQAMPRHEGSRLSVIVPKKVSKLATTRNYLKRVAYDTFYPLLRDKSLDCVIIFKSLPLKKSPALKQELIDELKQTAKTL